MITILEALLKGCIAYRCTGTGTKLRGTGNREHELTSAREDAGVKWNYANMDMFSEGYPTLMY